MFEGVVKVVPQPAEVAAIRERMGLTQSELAALMNVDLRTWMRKEAVNPDPANIFYTSLLTIGEANLLLLLADEHPGWRLKNYNPARRVFAKVIRGQPSSAEVRALRKALGLSLQQIADLFGYTVAAWKSKQSSTNSGTLKCGEWNFIMLLAGEHPDLTLIPRPAHGTISQKPPASDG